MAVIGQSNTFIHDLDASGGLITGYSRNPKKFKIASYAQITPAKKNAGFYLRVDQYNAMRLIGGNLDEFTWADGNPRPVYHNNNVEFALSAFRTIRRNFNNTAGKLAVDQADFKIGKIGENALAQKAMTARTRQAMSVLATSGNWDATHRKDVTTIPRGGLWSSALVTTPYIRIAVDFGINQIMLDTGSTVSPDELNLVFNPTTAFLISQTQEVLDHIKQSPDAYSQLEGGSGKWSRYGLPNKLFGVNVEVEDAVMVTTARGVTANPQYVMADGIAYLLSRPGGIQGIADEPSFSTLTVFAKEEMTVETRTDDYNRLYESNIVDDTVAIVTAPASGFAFLNLYS